MTRSDNNESLAAPTPGELEILQVLWRDGECSTREVNTVLNRKKEVGYTTTLKLMQLMTQKGLLGRKKDGKSHIYFPLTEQQATQASLLGRFIHTTFGGSHSKLVMSLLGQGNVSSDELDEIKVFLRDMETAATTTIETIDVKNTDSANADQGEKNDSID